MIKVFLVRKAAVLGAGVMGAQIAAHLVNANIETLLFELPGDADNPNANVIKAGNQLHQMHIARRIEKMDTAEAMPQCFRKSLG